MPDTMPDDLSRFGPAVIVVCAAAWVVLRAYFLKRRAGVSVVDLSGTRKSAVETGLAVTGILLDTYLLLRALWPEVDNWVPNWFQAPLPGLGFMLAGVLLMILSQLQMGTSWRIGMPESSAARHQLVTNGLYRFSRNPIYLGVFLFLAGTVLNTANLLTVASLLACGVLIPLQVAREEAFLKDELGPEFEAYRTRVRRWL